MSLWSYEDINMFYRVTKNFELNCVNLGDYSAYFKNVWKCLFDKDKMFMWAFKILDGKKVNFTLVLFSNIFVLILLLKACIIFLHVASVGLEERTRTGLMGVSRLVIHSLSLFRMGWKNVDQ